ncbi:MAG: AsmA family protein [Gammaproteobacteria bacterium]
MNIGRFLKYAAITLATILVLAVLLLSLIDFSRFKPDLEAAVQGATGREFRINGNFRVKALPSPSVLAEDVTLSNASWGSEPELLRVGQFSAKIGLWSLLFRPVVVYDLQLHDVDVLLETNADGSANWEMGEPVDEQMQPDDDDTGDAESPVDIRLADITDVNIVYRAPASDDMEFVLDTFTVETLESGRQALNGKGRFTDIPFTLDGSTGDEDAEVEATFGDVRFSSSTKYARNSIDIDVSLGSLDNVGKLIEIENLPAEDLTLAGNISVRGETVVLSDIVAGLGDARLTINGELDGADSTGKLKLEAEGSSLALLSPDLPPIPFSGTADVALAEESVDLDPFDLHFGDSDLSGRLHLEDGDSSVFSLEARSSLIDLSPFESGEEGDEADADSPPADEPTDRYVFRDDPLALEALQGLSAQTDIGIERFKTSTTELRSVELTAKIADGNLEFANSFLGQYGGQFENRLDIRTSDGEADMKIITKARDLKLGLLSGPDIPQDLIPASAVDVDISATGASPRALASSANGKVVVTQGPGRVKNDLIESFSGDVIAQLFSALNPFAEEDEFSNWECSVFRIDFESGLGDITGFLLQSEKLMVVGGGKIDLNSEELNIEFNTKPRQGVGVSADMFVTPFVKLSGTLANPTVGLNKKGVLLSGGAAVLTGGMSFLYQGLVDRATAEGGQCEQAFEAAGGIPENPAD